MKKYIAIVFLLGIFSITAQQSEAFKSGEWLKFRIHYGIFNACFATLHLKSASVNNTPMYYAVGEGKTTGFLNLFFRVHDVFESYFDKDHGKPLKSIINTYEGGYTKNVEIDFNHSSGLAHYNDKKKQQEHEIQIKQEIQDVISAFYYLRNRVDTQTIKKGDSVDLDMLFDDDGVFKFKITYLGKETLKTKFGKVECLKFRPLVQSGRVFKEKESITLWVSNDLNKIPIRIQAALAVGTLKADLHAFNGLKNQFKILVD